MSVKRVIASVATAGGLVLAGALPAHAADPIETFKNLHTGYCLGHDGVNDPYTWYCGTVPAQRWIVHHWADGTVRLQNYLSRRCLSDISGGLHAQTCNTSKNQSWWVKHYTDGSVRFQNQYSRLCVAGSTNTSLVRTSCTDDTNRRWK